MDPNADYMDPLPLNAAFRRGETLSGEFLKLRKKYLIMKSLNPSILYERIEKLEKINNDLNKRIIAREQQTLKWIERCIFSIVIVFLLLVCLFNGRVHDICVYIANYYWTVIAGTLTLFKNIFKDMFIKTFANISKIVSM